MSASVIFFPNKKLNTQTFTTVGANNFVVPDGVHYIWVEAWGAGGGGGGSVVSINNGSGGGAGGGFKSYMHQVTPGETVVITIGAGGAGGTTGDGASGGTTSINSPSFGTVSILGGQGGKRAVTNNTGNFGFAGMGPGVNGGMGGIPNGASQEGGDSFHNSGGVGAASSPSIGAGGGGGAGIGAGGAGGETVTNLEGQDGGVAAGGGGNTGGFNGTFSGDGGRGEVTIYYL